VAVGSAPVAEAVTDVAPRRTRQRRRLALRQTLVVALAVVVALAAAAASLTLGAVHVPLHDVIDALTGRAEAGPLREIVLSLRVPRMVEAIIVGAALGVSGVLLQGALGNPLASPDIVGVTGGAGFGAILVLLAFPSAVALLPVGALVFGALAGAIVLAIAWSGPSAGATGRLILAGIAVAALFGAGTTSLMVAFSDRVQSAVLWMAGGLSSDGWSDLRVAWPYFAAGFLIAAVLARPLDRLALGDDVAESLGAHPRRVRLAAVAGATLLASAAAALVGLLGFLGLVIPHLVRMAGGTAGHRYVMGTSALVGAALLLAGDTLARTVLAPIELPVGPFMVVLGVPVFLWLLRSAH
jgi:iron complex transport system permease protein